MRILVPLDFNAPSRHACEWAATYASRLGGCELYYLHVLEPIAKVEFLSEKRLKELEDEVESMRELAEQEMARVVPADRLQATVTVRYMVARGKPDLEIVRIVGEVGADMIVIGTHGRMGFDRIRLGSVTERVVRGAPCTVVVVKARPDDLAREQQEQQAEGS